MFANAPERWSAHPVQPSGGAPLHRLGRSPMKGGCPGPRDAADGLPSPATDHPTLQKVAVGPGPPDRPPPIADRNVGIDGGLQSSGENCPAISMDARGHDIPEGASMAFRYAREGGNPAPLHPLRPSRIASLAPTSLHTTAPGVGVLSRPIRACMAPRISGQSRAKGLAVLGV